MHGANLYKAYLVTFRFQVMAARLVYLGVLALWFQMSHTLALVALVLFVRAVLEPV
jgi:hypothetical protein